MQPTEDDLFGNSESPSLAALSLSSRASQVTTPYWDVINVDTNRLFPNGPLAIYLVSKLVYADTQRDEYRIDIDNCDIREVAFIQLR